MPTHMQTNKPPVEIPYGFDSHRPHIISLFVESKTVYFGGIWHAERRVSLCLIRLRLSGFLKIQ